MSRGEGKKSLHDVLRARRRPRPCSALPRRRSARRRDAARRSRPRRRLRSSAGATAARPTRAASSRPRPIPRRPRPDQHRHDQGCRSAARSHARDVAAADLVRHAHHPLRPDQQQESRRERPAELSGVRAGLEAVLATVITGADGTFTFNVTPKILTAYRATWKTASSLPVQTAVAPSISFGRINGFVTRVFAGRSMARKQVQLQRFSSFGQWVTIKRITLDLNSRARFQAAAPGRSEPAADRDVREPGRCGLPRRLQSGDRLPPRALTEVPQTGLATRQDVGYARPCRQGDPMKSRTIATLLALATAAALAVTAAFAAISAAPDPAQMALHAADIPDSKVKGKRLKPDGSASPPPYVREFELSKPYGSSHLLFISSEVALAAAREDADRRHRQLPEVPPLDPGPAVSCEHIAAELGTAVAQEERDTSASFGHRQSATRRCSCRWPVRTKGGAVLCRHLMVPRRPHALDPRGRRSPAHRPRHRSQSWAPRSSRTCGQQFTTRVDAAANDRRHTVQGQTLTTSTGTFSMTPT